MFVRAVLLISIAGVVLLLANAEVTAQGPQPAETRSAATSGYASLTSAADLGTGFTYQGALKKNGAPVSATCSMTFSLWDSLSSGAQIGGSQSVYPITVQGGLFTVVLNGANQFGATAFNGNARWLQTAVQCPSDGSPVTLSRQALNAAPYALYAAAPWKDNGGGLSYTGGVYISTTAGIAMDVETRSGGEALYAECLQSGNNCYAIEGYAPTGDYAGYMYGGKGVYAESDDAGQPGLDGNAYGANSYGVSGESQSYRGGYFKSDSNVLYSLYVDDADGPTQGTAALNVRGTIRIEGDLVVGGSKAGYVVDFMQNVDSVTLEAGDVVVLVGSSAPVLGQIPVVTVRKAASAYDSGVVGVVDEVWYAPDTKTRVAYESQEASRRAAMAARSQARAASRADRSKPADVPLPAVLISDAQGTLHALPGVQQAGSGGYVSAVTLGAFRMVKVDASFGSIHPGDLLTTSPNPGYAMKVSDKAAAIGAIIGKALGTLDSGMGSVPIMVTLR